MLERRLEAVLPACREHGVTIVTNMGAANPASAGARARELARRLGCHGLTIATVSGDDVYDVVMAGDFTIAETGAPVSTLKNRLISANAYIGAEPIVRALADGARLVITGRAADPSLFVAPLAYRLGWRLDAWPALARGHAGRPSARMCGAGHRRVFRGSRPQGRRRSGAPRISDRRGGGRGTDRHHQGERQRRGGHCRHLQGAAALRDPRSLGVHHS
jgi:hypothetical protein